MEQLIQEVLTKKREVGQQLIAEDGQVRQPMRSQVRHPEGQLVQTEVPSKDLVDGQQLDPLVEQVRHPAVSQVAQLLGQGVQVVPTK